MNHGSLFSGIGGFDLASQWMEWNNCFHAEISAFNRRILQYYWPNAKTIVDVRTADFSFWRGKIDILTGGFPCQPYSTAGKRLGTEDDRHLWPFMLDAIRAITPKWIIGENVSGIVSWNGGLVFDQVQADLEAEAYEVWPIVLPAASVGAPHRRDRVWFVAYRTDAGIEGVREGWENEIHGLKDASNTSSDGFGERTDKQIEQSECIGSANACTSSSERITSHATRQQSKLDEPKQREASQQEQGESGRGYREGDVTNANNQGLQGSKKQGSIREVRKERNEYTTGCVRANWDKFPAQSPICSRDDGLSAKLDRAAVFEGVQHTIRSNHRTRFVQESIKGYGNAIVPQIAHELFKVIAQMEATK